MQLRLADTLLNISHLLIQRPSLHPSETRETRMVANSHRMGLRKVRLLRVNFVTEDQQSAALALSCAVVPCFNLNTKA